MHVNDSNGKVLESQQESLPVRLSVIIPCYNGAEYLGMQLESLARQKWDEPWEIVLADNRSTDDSVVIARQYQEKLPNLRIVSASEKQGKPYAVNVAAWSAKGEALLFVDADDEVGEGWLSAMGEALKKRDFVASRIDIEKLNSVELQKARPNPQKDGLQQYTYPPYLPHAGGGTLGIKRSLFEAVGGMDENMLLLEDTDLCWRLQNSGTKLYFVPEAVLHYRYRGTVFSLFKQGIGYGEYNVVLYKRYRSYGMPKLNPKKGLYKWVRLFLHLPRLLNNEQRPRFMRVLGWNIGRLIGSVKHRIWAL
jgi:glycosyltransferase involved in cell wall biosynthesis